ncbi:SapC family protein [Xanthomonas albilineans]|uniref:SapC family protein n=1 Tax=Xanthomonas albilineans TaxID=29447 RepID=UPI0005F3576F|nr:SapC family protein [Xanthomonas albilineans]
MAQFELLNNVTHHDLRVILRFGAAFGDAIGMVQAFPTEFADLQREYPIFLRKNAIGSGFHAVALLGFEPQENLFLQGERWNAAYLPGAIAKGPFLIGFQERHEDGIALREPVIHVDLEHPRISRSEGEPIFLPQGGHSTYLEHIITVLRGIRDGVEGGDAMFAAFDALGLIQPLRINVQLDSAHAANLTDLYGIDRERLAALDAAALHGLHHAGYLEGAYLILASMQAMRWLMAEKQRRLQQGDAMVAA